MPPSFPLKGELAAQLRVSESADNIHISPPAEPTSALETHLVWTYILAGKPVSGDQFRVGEGGIY